MFDEEGIYLNIFGFWHIHSILVAQPLTTNFDVVMGYQTYQNISNNYYSFVATTSVVRYLVIIVVAICPHDSINVSVCL